MYEIEFYQSEEDGLWRWRIFAGNGKNIANGSEGYSRKYNAQRTFGRFMAQQEFMVRKS